MANYSNPTTHLEGKSSKIDESVYKNGEIRESSVIESFVLTKGKGTVHLYFETIPIWLPALAPMCVQYICFSQYNHLDELKSINNITTIFINNYLMQWPKDKIKFKKESTNRLTLVLVSGSRKFWNQIKNLDLNAPSLFTFEGKSNPKIKDVKLIAFRNFLKDFAFIFNKL